MKKILFALCAGLLSLTAASCAKDEDNDVNKKYTVYGSVYDANTGKPLKNASVIVCDELKEKDSYDKFNDYDDYDKFNDYDDYDKFIDYDYDDYDYDEFVPKSVLGSTVTGSDGNFVVTFTTDAPSEYCYLLVACDGYVGSPMPFKPASDKKLDIPMMLQESEDNMPGTDDVIYRIGSSNIMVQPQDLGMSTYSGAVEACQNSRLGGYDDWRLPTLAEMMAIYDVRDRIQSATHYMFSTQTPYWTSDEIYDKKDGRVLYVLYMELQDDVFNGGYDSDYVLNHKEEFLRSMASPNNLCRVRAVRTIKK